MESLHLLNPDVLVAEHSTAVLDWACAESSTIRWCFVVFINGIWSWQRSRIHCLASHLVQKRCEDAAGEYATSCRRG